MHHPANTCPLNLKHHPPIQRRGFTLIELLLVITVLAVLVALVVPGLRIATRDRRVREAARTVGSFVSTARTEAIANGGGGFGIERSVNDPDKGFVLYRLRAQRPYSGDIEGQMVTITPLGPNTFTCAIPTPFDHDPMDEDTWVIRVFDRIQFNQRGARYLIRTDPDGLTTPGTLTFVCFADASKPLPAAGMVPFKIFRQPTRSQHGEKTLSEREFVYFKFSGIGGAAADSTPYPARPNIAPIPVDFLINGIECYHNGAGDLVVWFDDAGRIDMVLVNGVQGASQYTLQYPESSPLPDGSLYLMVATNDSILVDPADPNSPDPDLMWVVINHNTSSVSVTPTGNSTGPDSPVSNLRQLSRNRISATQ